MQISDKGIDLIKSFEAYMKKLPDGGCMAYQERLGTDKAGKPILDIPTLGWGCTRGVKMGMRWTAEQAEQAFRLEIAEHEAIVNRLITADVSQGAYDACVSFNYNCGRLSKSTLLKKLNAGDTMGAAAEFSKFTYAGGVQLKGLVRRRAAEKALFLSDVEVEEPEHCPQQSDKGKPIGVIIKENKEAVAVVAAAVTGAGGTVATQAPSPAQTAPASPVPSQPAPQAKQIDPKQVIAKAQETKAMVEDAKGIATYGVEAFKWARGDGFYPSLIMVLGIAALFGANWWHRRSS